MKGTAKGCVHMTAKVPLGYSDRKQLIEALLRRKFPGSWAPPPIQPLRPGGFGGSNAGAVELHRQRMEHVDTERKRLTDLPDADLLAMQKEIEAKEKAKRDAEIATLEAVFHAPDNDADFDFWCKAEYWTFDEAIALLLGKDPKKLPVLLMTGTQMRETPFARGYSRLYELGKRATAMQGARLRPITVIRWASETGAVKELPPELLRMPLPPAPSSAGPAQAHQTANLPAAEKDSDAERFRRMRGYPPLAAPSFAGVNWSKWGLMPRVPLWKAVCLSLGLEPREDIHGYGLRTQGRFGPGTPNLQDRLEILQANLSTDGPIRPQGALYQGMLQNPSCEVLQAEVAAFLLANGIDVPAEMRAPVDRDNRPASEASAPPQRGSDARDSGWSIGKPERTDALSRAIYETLQSEHQAGRRRPTASDLLTLWKQKQPPCVVRFMADGVAWAEDEQGAEEQSADRKQLGDRIYRMTKNTAPETR